MRTKIKKQADTPKLTWQSYRTSTRRLLGVHQVLTEQDADFLMNEAADKYQQGDRDSILQSLQSLQVVCEDGWVKGDRPTYFADLGLVDFLKASNFDVSSLDVSKFAAGIFAISWSPDARFNKQPLFPTLVVVKPNFVIYYTAGASRREQGAGSLIGFLPLKAAESADEDNEASFYAEITLRFLAYLQAFPDLARPGFPAAMRARDVRHSESHRAAHVSLHPKLRAMTQAHWRSGHFRVLRHERYKRNPNGTPRVIYVNPMIVGKLTPYTVEEEHSQLGKDEA